MKHPEVPKKRSDETPTEALKSLQKEVRLPAEAIPTRDRTVDVLANARDERLALIASMQQETNVPKADLRRLETILTA